MAGVEINDLTLDASPAGTAELVFQITGGGTTKKTTVANLSLTKSQISDLTVDTLAEVLAIGNTTGGTDLAVSAGDDITFTDTSKAIFGAGSDLQIYHDGGTGDSIIAESGAGNLFIRGANTFIQNPTGSSTYMRGIDGGAVDIRYAGATKLATTATGIDVTGTVTATGTSVFASLDISGDIDVDGTTNLDVVDIDGAVDFASTTAHAGNATFADNAKAIFGAGSDLEIYHDGSHSYIKDTATGNLRLDGTDIQIRSDTGANMAAFVSGAGVQLYHNNQKKLDTTATGIDVTGTVTADGLTVDGLSQLGTISIYDSGTNATVAADSAHDLELRGRAGQSVNIFSNGTKTATFDSVGDVSFYEDTGTTAKLFWDASAESLGIGTSTPQELLHLAATAPVFRMEGASRTYQQFVSGTDFFIRDVTAGLNRVTLDSSGNLLVGKTSTAFGTAGIEARAGGTLWATASATNAASFNRLSTDGPIAYFSKDGTAIGSIGVVSGNNLNIFSAASGHSGLSFGTGIVYATDNAGDATNGATSLGSDSYKWQDLYLSGGVYLGGTGAANKLDDFEVGTWTPTGISAGSIDVATYTKIGDVVVISLAISGAITLTTGTIGGLPFSAVTTSCPWYFADFAVGAGEIPMPTISGTEILLRTADQATGGISTLGDLTGSYISITATYHV